MSDNGIELRRIAWDETFPFVRLFKPSIHYLRLLLGLTCVVLCFLGGRVLDGLWTRAGSGALVAVDTHQSEVDAYAAYSSVEFRAWKARTQAARNQSVAKAAVAVGNASDLPAALQRTATQPARELTQSSAHQKDCEEGLKIVDRRLDAGLKALDDDKKLTKETRRAREDELKRSADCLRLTLTGHGLGDFSLPIDPNAALVHMNGVGDGLTVEQRVLLSRAIAAQLALSEVGSSTPRGPFLTLLKYESSCFAAAIRGVCSFHWGFGGPSNDGQPSLGGSIAAAGSGVVWLFTQRPCFFVFYALWHFLVFAFFGGAICRHIAVQTTRDESLGFWDTIGFAREKYFSLVIAAVLPGGAFVLVALAIWGGSLIGAIPWIGELLTGILYGLTLLGGFALAMIFIVTVLGLHLMWPTIAVEGSDAFDGVTHAAGYVGQRPWKLGFYSLVMLLYGGVAFVMIRIIALLLLKLTHLLSNAGISWFHCWHSSETSTITKLDAMWHMPAWENLSLLPAVGGVPFWGSFNNAPLNGSEGLAMLLIRLWVFVVVGLVGAYVVNFFFCASTQMYLVLRRDVDAVDYDEIYFEETEEAPPVEFSIAEPGTPPPPPADQPPAEA